MVASDTLNAFQLSSSSTHLFARYRKPTMKASILTSILTLASTAVPVFASYAASCSDCHLEGRSSGWLSGDDKAPVLTCKCGDGKGGNPTTSLDLNKCIINQHGFMFPYKKYRVPNCLTLFDSRLTSPPRRIVGIWGLPATCSVLSALNSRGAARRRCTGERISPRAFF